MSRNHPQNRTFNLVVNEQQLADLRQAMQLLAEQRSEDTVYDTDSLYYVPVKDTAELLQKALDSNQTGLCWALCL